LTTTMPEPKLLARLHEAIRLRALSRRTEEAYRHWIIRFVRFHDMRHPATLGVDDVRAFLSHLAVVGNVAPSTQNQALSALLFLYRHLLGNPLWTDYRQTGKGRQGSKDSPSSKPV
jgi:site-specific recombinase XerD